jgi:hypothetical protein
MSTNTTRSFYRPEGELTDKLVRDILFVVGVISVGPAVIATWTEFERLIVVDWAMREHLHASDNPVRRRPRPRGLLE